MESACRFRDVLPSDAAAVTRHRFDGSVNCDVEREAYAIWVSERIALGTYLGCVAQFEGEIVAGAGIVLLDWGPTRGNASGVSGRVVAVFTEPALRRRGLATALVREVMQRAAAGGVRDFRLAASPEGAGIYRELGFRPYGAEMVFKA
jgi:GNAT superfamily N-acetyltransferase